MCCISKPFWINADVLLLKVSETLTLNDELTSFQSGGNYKDLIFQVAKISINFMLTSWSQLKYVHSKWKLHPCGLYIWPDNYISIPQLRIYVFYFSQHPSGLLSGTSSERALLQSCYFMWVFLEHEVMFVLNMNRFVSGPVTFECLDDFLLDKTP